MNRMRFCLLIFGLMVAFSAQSESTCANTDTILDGLLWHGCYQPYKDWFTQFYGIKESNWDEGWGWQKCESKYAFPKMWNATTLMAQIDQTQMGRWRLDSIQDVAPDGADRTPGLNGPRTASQPVVVLDIYSYAYVFIRSGDGELIFYRYDTTELPPAMNLTYENVTQRASNPAGATLAFDGPLSVRFAIGERLAVFGLSGNNPAPMMLFLSTGAGWEARPLTTTSQELRMSTPAVLRADSDATYLIGINGNGRLVEYMLSSNYDLTSLSMLPFMDSTWRVARNPEGLEARIFDNRLEVFAPRDPDGKLLYFWRDLPNGAWHAENITSSVSAAPALAPGSRLALLKRNGANLTIFGRNSAGELIRYARDRRCVLNLAALGCVMYGNVWSAENVSRVATVEASPPPGQTWNLRTNIMSGPYAVLASDGTERVFGIGYGLFGAALNHVMYFYRTTGSYPAWRTTDLTMNTTGGNAPLMDTVQVGAMNPVTLLSGGEGARLFALNNAGRLVRYHCPRAGESCSSAVIGDQHNPTLHNSFPTGGTSSGVSDHVVAVEIGSRRLLHHQFVGDHAWHASEDYENWASGYIHDFYYKPVNETPGDGRWADAEGGFWQFDKVNLYCRVFDSELSVVGRPAIMLHEATHLHYWGDYDHSNPETDIDPFIMHRLGDIPFGTLDPAHSGHEHSPYQIQIEYLADLAQFGFDSVPWIIRSSAESIANSMLIQRIQSSSGWRWKVGIPRPM